MNDIKLSLIAHTNVGKTTLARTLLGRDIGEVRDAAHVTEVAQESVLLGPVDGVRMLLWDTPGFGDSVRLVRRMRQAKGALGWFLTEVWDRYTDRGFWFSQQALKHVREHSDLVLYLINAAQDPTQASEVDAELELLALLGKPVIALLNQLGTPREPALEAAELARWRSALAHRPEVHSVLALDAFSRCWVQEGVLLDAITIALPTATTPAMIALRAAWRERALGVFDAAITDLAATLAQLAAAREAISAPPIIARLRRTLGAGSEHAPEPTAGALLKRVEKAIAASTTRLLEIHHLDGKASAQLHAQLAQHYDYRLTLDAASGAAAGGVLAGALTGLKADLATGGLSLGGGMLVGAVLGALGGAGGARLVNWVRGRDASTVGLADPALDALYAEALLRYLAVAHFGRGRGDWREDPRPAHWLRLVEDALDDARPVLHSLWAQARTPRPETSSADAHALQRGLDQSLRRALTVILRKLYPNAASHLPRD